MWTRAEMAGEGDIVETDNGYILRNEASRQFEGAHCADRRVVIPGKDRVEV